MRAGGSEGYGPRDTPRHTVTGDVLASNSAAYVGVAVRSAGAGWQPCEEAQAVSEAGRATSAEAE